MRDWSGIYLAYMLNSHCVLKAYYIKIYKGYKDELKHRIPFNQVYDLHYIICKGDKKNTKVIIQKTNKCVRNEAKMLESSFFSCFIFQVLQARPCGLWEIRLHLPQWHKLQVSQLFPGVAVVRNFLVFILKCRKIQQIFGTVTWDLSLFEMLGYLINRIQVDNGILYLQT